MRTLSLAVMLTAASALTAFATTSDQLELISGASSITITDNSGTDGNPANGTISYTNSNFNGWNISVASGTSHSPGLTPFGLDVASLTATCSSGGCTSQALDIIYSDVSFTTAVPIGGFNTTFSLTETGTGTASQTAWFANNNTIFSQQNVIGTVGPFSSSSVGSASGGTVAAIPSYSLTVEQVFTSTGSSVSFSADGNVTANVPEPAAIVLFGTVLAVCAAGFRRRKAR